MTVESNNPKYDSRDNCNAIILSSNNELIAGCKNTVVPNSVTVIGGEAFLGYSDLISIYIPNSVGVIGWGAFRDCGLTSINIPNSVTTIDNMAFMGCNELNSISIPNSIITIKGSTFSGCAGLKKVDIGNSLTSIDDWAFQNCNDLTNVYCYATIPPTCNEKTFTSYSATLHVPATSLAAYFTAPVWSNFENIVGDAVAPTGIVISEDSVEMQIGQQRELTTTIIPTNASCKEVTWYSTNINVATVDNGTVTATGYGECDIIASCFGMQAICHVSVTNRIALDQQAAMLLPNHMLTLTPSAPATPDGFTVTSSDPTVAAARVMSGKVQVVGIKEGSTTITVGSADGTAIPATCLVTVYTEPGDVNCDGFVDINDVTLLISVVLGEDVSSFKRANADLNDDDILDINDVTMLIRHILGK